MPEFIPQERIGVFPAPVKFAVAPSSLDYSLSGVAADFRPQAIPLPATGWNATRQWRDSRGYLDFGLGSWLTSTLSAGYRIVDTKKSTLGVRLQHNSTSLWKPSADMLLPSGSWQSGKETRNRLQRYDEALGIYGAHNFDGKGTLSAAIDYHLGYFNYYGFAPSHNVMGSSVPANLPNAPTQTLNDVAARVKWTSPTAVDKIRYSAYAGVRYFGYRRLYLFNGQNPYAPESLSGGRETDVNLGAAFFFPLSGKSSIGVELDSHIVGYSDFDSEGGERYDIVAPDTYGTVALTPYYRFAKERLNVKIGARIDLAFNAGPEHDRFNAFHIAPQVTVDYNAGAATLFLHLLGGNALHTLASGYELDYYQTPAIFNTAPVYTPVDAKLGADFGPFSGFSAGVDFAYRFSKKQYLGGWYTAYLNNDDSAIGSLPEEIAGSRAYYDYFPETRADISGVSIGVNAAYDAGRYFKVSAEGRYQPQHGKKGYFNGLDRPRWTLDARIESNPWSTLKFRLSYNYRGVRTLPVAGWSQAGDAVCSLENYRLPDLCMLNFGVAYDITSKIGVWGQVDNILNRHDDKLPCLPGQGIILTAGLSLLF